MVISSGEKSPHRYTIYPHTHADCYLNFSTTEVERYKGYDQNSAIGCCILQYKKENAAHHTNS